MEENNSNDVSRSHGGRNLIIMGIISITVAVITTSVSLYLYRVTGDLYLDRSRPGFISEGEEHNKEDDRGEDFSSEGAMTAGSFDKYLEQLDTVTERIDGSAESFSAEPLSDDSLGITIYEDLD
jgi:hypothetical protein